MKKFLTMVVAAGLPFGAGMTLYFVDKDGPTKGLILGIASGILFGVIIASIGAHRARQAATLRPQYEAEGLLRDAIAQRSVDKLFAGGWLFLTKQRLAFEPSKSNASMRFELPLSEIAEVKLLDKAFKKQIQVIDKLHQTHAFTVVEREMWVISISRAVEAAAAPAQNAV